MDSEQSLQGYESNRRHDDGFRAGKESHESQLCFLNKEDSKLNERRTVWSPAFHRQGHLHVNVQRHWMEKQKGNERCEDNTQTVASYARKFPRCHHSFLQFGSENKWCGTDKPEGSWIQSTKNMMTNFSDSGHPIFRVSSGCVSREENYEAK